LGSEFREYLAGLEKAGLLRVVRQEVSTDFEISAGIRHSSDRDGPAWLFENIKGYPGWRVAAGLFATKRLLAAALRCREEELGDRMSSWEGHEKEPVLVDTAPCQEIVWTGDDVDVGKLPVCLHSEHDAGRYVTAALQIGKNPHTGRRNVSIHRMLVMDRDLLSLWAPADHHLGRSILDAEALGRGLEVASFLGAHPLVQLGSQARVPMGVDEFAVAGALRGKPVELVRCKTIDAEVPADCEVVIEGVTIPGRRVADGPFAEYPGTYSETKQGPCLRVTAITMRRSPIYQTALTGMPMTENHWMVQHLNEAAVRKEVTKIVPEVVAINVTPGGSARHHVVVSLRKKHDAESRNVILALLAPPGLGIKRVVVVDDDIDVFDPSDVEWAINTRVQPDRDIIIVPNMNSSTLDPSAPAPRTTGKWGIDATMPLGDQSGYRKAYVPGQEKPHYL